MNKKEFGIFASALRTYYPKEQLLPNEQAMELWYQELKDLPMEVATTAMRKWVSTEKWSPTIAELRQTAAGIQNVEPPDWSEAWETVLLAIRRHGMYNPREALDSLDDVTRDCVNRIGFRNLCLSENIMADRAAFRHCYEIIQNRRKQEQQLSLPLQETIKQIQLKGMDGNLLTDGGSA